MKINNFVPDSKIFETVGKQEVKEQENGEGFLSVLKGKLDEVNDKQIKSDEVTDQFVKGDGADIHEVMLTAEEAKMSLELAVQMRNKIVEAYQEINRMQV